MTASTFSWQGHELPYLAHPYNRTAQNERAIEIPIALAWLAEQMLPEDTVLEVGNVLSHYLDVPLHRTVLDRYGVDDTGARGVELDQVEALDVFDWVQPADLIVSISTLEHVRWDRPEEKIPGGSFAAIAHLRALLRPQGRMLVTIPLGCNPPLDRLLLAEDGNLADVLRCSTLVRVPEGLHPVPEATWVETDRPTVAPYNRAPWWGANAVWIGDWVA